MNYNVGSTATNAAIIPVAANGKIQFRASTKTDLVVDVQGYYTTGSTAPGGYVPLEPTRLADSRFGTGIAAGTISSGASRTIQAAGTAGIPLDAASVVLNVTVVGPTANGLIDAHAADAPASGTHLTFVGGRDNSISTVVPLSNSSGLTGAFKLDVLYATIDVVVDVVGYFKPGAAGGGFNVARGRLLDTRSTSAIMPGSALTIPVEGVLGLPSDSVGAVALHVAAVPGATGGLIKMWPSDATEATAPVLNYPAQTVVSNFAIVAVGATGQVTIKNEGSSSVHIILDLEGWYTDLGVEPENAPTTPDVAVAPCLSGCIEGLEFTDTLTPTLSATSQDADGGALTYSWQVRKATAPTMLVSGQSTSLAGSPASWQIPIGRLEEDQSYLARVLASDGYYASGWSEWLEFGVDTDSASLSPTDVSNAIAKTSGMFAARNDVWIRGQAAVSTPSPSLVSAAGGRTAAFDASLTTELGLRQTVTDLGMRISSAATSVDNSYVQRTSAGLRVTSIVSRWQTYTDPATGVPTEAGWTDRYQLTFPSTAGSGLTSTRTLPEAYPEISTGGAPRAAMRSATPVPAIPEPDEASGTGITSYDRDEFAEYAKYWTKKSVNKMNPDYPNLTNDCANFVSQALDQAGWPLKNGWIPTKLDNWHYDLMGPAGPSRTWSQAKKLFEYAVEEKDLLWMDNIWNARKSDLLFLDWDNDGDSEIDHVVAVSGRLKGTPRISSKTSNRHNMFLNTWIKIINETTGPEPIWYGRRNAVPAGGGGGGGGGGSS